MSNEYNTPWELVEHSWSDTSIYDDNGDVVCTKNIRHVDTPNSQDSLEKKVRKDFDLLMAAPRMLEALERAVEIIGEHLAHSMNKELEDLQSVIDEARGDR